MRTTNSRPTGSAFFVFAVALALAGFPASAQQRKVSPQQQPATQSAGPKTAEASRVLAQISGSSVKPATGEAESVRGAGITWAQANQVSTAAGVVGAGIMAYQAGSWVGRNIVYPYAVQPYQNYSFNQAVNQWTNAGYQGSVQPVLGGVLGFSYVPPQRSYPAYSTPPSIYRIPGR